MATQPGEAVVKEEEESVNWKWINRSAIFLQIAMLSHSAWIHDWRRSIFWSFCIVGNAAYHWKTPKKIMTIEVIAGYYRETFLSSLFLSHYETWTDRITFITERSEGNKFDDEDKMNWVNAAIARSTADWVVLVDMDEFVMPRVTGIGWRWQLENTKEDIIYSQMVRLWRHRTDKDIDPTQPPMYQRLHGQIDHRKPCLFRPKGVTVGVGNHNASCPEHYKVGTDWDGAHWANADSCFWIERETRDRGPRLTERNKAQGYGTHTLRTKEQILAECAAHLDDPQVIFP